MAPRIEVIKSFATGQECLELNAWVNQGVQNKWLDLGYSNKALRYEKRLTTRMYGGRCVNPKLALYLQQRICAHWGLSSFGVADTAGGNDGIVVSCTYKGGDVHLHTDPRCGAPLSTLRCNLLSSAAGSGCKLHIDGQPVAVDEGDLVCYLVTDWPHYVTENLGDKPRNLWMFGWYVPLDAWESGQIGVQH